jgi:lipoate-protein ligase B
MLVRDLGIMPYRDALDVQRQTHAQVLDGQLPGAGALLVVEHPPVITIGRRGNPRKHIVASPERLAQLGIEVVETDRGGDVTYHGPGQVVLYPIVPLADRTIGVGSYMRLLEQVVIDTVAAYGIAGERDHCATGVWIGGAKLCAMGVRVRRRITMHGLAVNVTTDMSHFDAIVPCGLAGRPVTSLRQLLGNSTPPLAVVKTNLVETFQRTWLS